MPLPASGPDAAGKRNVGPIPHWKKRRLSGEKYKRVVMSLNLQMAPRGLIKSGWDPTEMLVCVMRSHFDPNGNGIMGPRLNWLCVRL